MGYTANRKKELNITSTSSYTERRKVELQKEATQNVAPSKNPFTTATKGLSLPGLKINSAPKVDPSAVSASFKNISSFKDLNNYKPFGTPTKSLPWSKPTIKPTQMPLSPKEEYLKKLDEQKRYANIDFQDFQAKHPILAATQQTLDKFVKKPIDVITNSIGQVLDPTPTSMKATQEEIDLYNRSRGKATTTGNKIGDVIFNTAGQIMGIVGQPSMGGIGGGGSIGSGLTDLTKGTEYGLTKIIPKIASKPIIGKAIQGVVESLPFSAQQAGVQGMSPKETVKTFGINAGLGGAIGGGIGVFGKVKSAIGAKKLLAKDTLKPISQETKTGSAVWRNKNVDQPINVIGDLGETNGKRYVKIEGSNTGVPLDEIKYQTVAQDALKPQSNIGTLGKELKAQNGIKLQTLGQDTISKVKTNTIAKTDMLTQVEKNMLDNKDFTYDVKTETKSIAEAQARLTSDFKGEVASLNSKETFSGVDVDSMFGVVESELKAARATGDYSQVHSMLKNTRKAGTTSGQAVQAFAKYSRTSEGALVDAQRAVDTVEEGLKKTNPNLINKINTEVKQSIKDITDLGQTPDPEQIRDFVKKKYGLPTLSDGDIKNITENMDKSKTFAEGSYNQNAYLTKARQIIADKVPATKYEKFRGLQRISLILNPKSLIARNPLGNTILGAAETAKDVPGALIDKLVSLGTGQRTTALNPFNKLKGQYEGFKQGVGEFSKDIKLGVDTSPSRGQYELPSSRVFENKTLNAIDQFERKALQLGDRPFYQAAYNGRIAELKGLGRTIDETAHAEAKLYALDRVFQSNSNLSKGAKQIKEGINKIVPMLGDIAMPFTQTPANIMDKLLDYSPVGFAKSISQIGSIGKGTFNQKLFVDRIGRALTGAGIGALGYTMAAKGVIVGQRNADTDVANFEQGLGKNPYAVKIGDHYFTFDWAQPISGLLAAGADAYQAGKDKKDFLSALGAGATAAGNTFVNQSFLQGVVTLMSGYSPVAGVIKTALSAPLQAAPTVGSNIAKLIDPYVRETYDPNPLKQMANRFVAKIPFASKTLPVKIDQSGQEIKQQQGVGIVQKALNLFINPSTSTTFRPDSTQKEILRLYSEGGTKIQVPTVVDKTISKTKDHPQVNLTPTEFTQYQKRTGQLTINGGTLKGIFPNSGNTYETPFKGFASVMDSPDYKNTKATENKTADENRAALLAAIIEQAKAQAKKEILQARGYGK